MSINKGIALGIIWVILSILSYGQGNVPSNVLSEKEKADRYRKGLALDKIPDDAIQLRRLSVIPLENEIDKYEIYFRNVLSFSIDERGHIYIPDGILCSIYEFDKSGRYLNKYQRKGQGPGDMMSPNRILLNKNVTIVHDGQPRRISYYDKKWKFQGSFSYYKQYSYVSVDNKNRIYAVNVYDRHLIDVLNEKGELIKSFGEMTYKMGSSLNRAVVGISREGTIWIGMEALGIIKKYNNEGNPNGIINIGNIGSELLKKEIRSNIEWDKVGNKNYFQIIRSISFIGDDALVLVGGVTQPVFRFDRNGKIKKIYYLKPTSRYIHFYECKGAIDESGNEKIYLLMDENDEKYIGVYVDGEPRTKGEKDEKRN